ncbi:MAG: hypothetical protein CM15mP25_0030 [Gammaproteobacteria bacterium]|nr:MAG: hypothetical protein CM15mP25_0030 [Gammaproteobacteria bacterium]
MGWSRPSGRVTMTLSSSTLPTVTLVGHTGQFDAAVAARQKPSMSAWAASAALLAAGGEV